MMVRRYAGPHRDSTTGGAKPNAVKMSSQRHKKTDHVTEWLSATPASGNQSIVDWIVTTAAIVTACDGRLYRRLVPGVRLALPVALFKTFSNQRLRLLFGIPRNDRNGKPQSIRITLSLDTFQDSSVWKMNRAMVQASSQLRSYAKFISKEHLTASKEENWIVLEDQSSTNGTWIELSQLKMIADEIKRSSNLP